MTQNYRRLLDQGRDALSQKNYTLAHKRFAEARDALREYAVRRYLSLEGDVLDQLLRRAQSGALDEKKNTKGT